jgi:hypothetical protein
MAQLFQNDPQWANNKIGLQNSLTISQVGCLLTSMAMVVNHFGGNVTPASLNNMMKGSGGFNGAWIKSAQVPSQFPQLGMQRQKWEQCEGTPASVDLIDAGLAAGSLIVVRVDWSADPGIQGHWVVIHAKDGDDYLIWDPWQKDGASNKLTERYTFTGKKPADVILEANWHGKVDLTSPSAPPPVPAATTSAPSSSTARKDTTPTAKQTQDGSGVTAVKPTVDQLSMRQQPATGTIVKLLSPSDTLTVLESSADAQAKIGTQGQWLHVRTADGVEGYIAGWLVEATTAPMSPAPDAAAAAPAVPASPADTAATAPAVDLKVKTTGDQVSLRATPRVVNNNLITFLAKGSELQVVETGDAAAKIGVQNQWLHIRTSDGKTGYVAAWYVAKV